MSGGLSCYSVEAKLQPIPLRCHTPRLLHRVLLCVLHQLPAHGLFHVHIKVVGEVGQEYGNVHDLLGSGFAAFSGNGGQVGISGPPYGGCAPSVQRLPRQCSWRVSAVRRTADVPSRACLPQARLFREGQQFLA